LSALLISTINSNEKYFKDFQNCTAQPWEVKPIPHDHSWGVYPKHDDNLKADIYFLNEGFLNHLSLYREIGPSSNYVAETDCQKDLSLRGLNDKRYFAKEIAKFFN
jgi:hypothetical protein